MEFLLGVVEDGLPSDPTEQLPDIFLNLVLSFNLHHTGEQSTSAGCCQTWLQVTFLLLATLLLRQYFFFHAAPGNNVIMQQLRKKNVKILSEKVLLLLNRGGKNASFFERRWRFALAPALIRIRPSADDPVCMFNHTPPAPHSVLKFLQDVFASRETADIFYRTDMMVMIDIAVRQISDLSPGDKVSSSAWKWTVVALCLLAEI